MTKYINTENILKGIYTKNELRFIKAQDWTLIPQSAYKFAERIKVSDWTCKYEWLPSSRQQLTKEIEKRSKAVRKQMDEYFRTSYYHKSLEAWIKAEDERIKKEAQAKREHDAINAMLKEDGLYGIDNAFRSINLGTHVGTLTAAYGKSNGITCNEDFDRYSRGCKYWKVTRSFTITIRKGYHLFAIGGLLTFVKGNKIDRHGMACEWIEQGRELSRIRTVKGWLVRGEHIEAKTLKEAQAINAEHRAKEMANLLAARKKDTANRIKEASLMITFEDSLASGNCRPGTQAFKDKYEAAIGHEASYIMASDLRKYAKKFGVEYYAERVINYAKNH